MIVILYRRLASEIQPTTKSLMNVALKIQLGLQQTDYVDKEEVKCPVDKQ